MLDRLTPAELEAMQARADAATPGPWTVHNDARFDPDHYTISSPGNCPELDIRATEYVEHPFYGPQGKADADFIAAARADVPALLAEVRALQQELADIWTAMQEAGLAMKMPTHRHPFDPTSGGC